MLIQRSLWYEIEFVCRIAYRCCVEEQSSLMLLDRFSWTLDTGERVFENHRQAA